MLPYFAGLAVFTRISYKRKQRIKHITKDNLYELLRKSWAIETSYDPKRWTISNPAYGQCAISSLIVQDYFSGRILLGYVANNHHYYNELPNRIEFDTTREQFNGCMYITDVMESSRGYLLSSADTKKRYLLLKEKVEYNLHQIKV